MAFPERLLTAHTDLEALFEDLHAANVEAHQANPHLREAVSAVSSAMAAVERALKHVIADVVPLEEVQIKSRAGAR